MNIDRQDGRMILTLPGTCTIAEVEAAADKLRSMPDDVTALKIDAAGVSEMDTAFFQLLLSLKATMEIRGKPFQMSAESSEVRGLYELYGVRL